MEGSFCGRRASDPTRPAVPRDKPDRAWADRLWTPRSTLEPRRGWGGLGPKRAQGTGGDGGRDPAGRGKRRRLGRNGAPWQNLGAGRAGGSVGGTGAQARSDV